MAKDAAVYNLFSSSSGNCTYIRYGSEELLIDVGGSARMISNALLQLGTELKNIRAIFITHEHTDHIKGLETITKYYRIPIYAPEACCGYISDNIEICSQLLCANDDGDAVYLDDIKVSAYNTPHDSLGSVCYRLSMGNIKLGYATDIGHITPNLVNALAGCDTVVIESNHDLGMLKNGSYPYSIKKRIMGDYGHLSNVVCADFSAKLAKYGTKSLTLAHLSQQNNRPEIAFSECRNSLIATGLSISGEVFAGDVSLNVALPAKITKIL